MIPVEHSDITSRCMIYFIFRDFDFICVLKIILNEQSFLGGSN